MKKIEAIISVILLAGFISACDGSAHVYVWEDVNCNGIVDSGEQPIEGVCVKDNYYNKKATLEDCNDKTFDFTDKNGDWWSRGYVASGMGYQLTVFTPEGFIPTTRAEVSDFQAQVGFAREGTCNPRLRLWLETNKILIIVTIILLVIGILFVIRRKRVLQFLRNYSK